MIKLFAPKFVTNSFSTSISPEKQTLSLLYYRINYYFCIIIHQNWLKIVV